MEQPCFVNLGDIDIDKVNIEEAPSSAEQYLRQVAAGRARCPSVVVATVPHTSPRVERVQKVRDADPLAPSREWQLAKASDFSYKRSVFDSVRHKLPKVSVQWPHPGDAGRWRSLILEESVVELSEEVKKAFADDHTGTPPTLAVLNGLGPIQVNYLVPFIVELSEPEEDSESDMETSNMDEGRTGDTAETTTSAVTLTRQLREWMYALLMVVDKPLLHDVVAGMRQMAKKCREERKLVDKMELGEKQKESLKREFSFFIAVIAIYFEQKDLADCEL